MSNTLKGFFKLVGGKLKPKVNFPLTDFDDRQLDGVPYPELTRAEIEALPNKIKGQKFINTDVNTLVEWDGTDIINLTNNTIIIREKADLPTAVGGAIQLENATRYLITGHVDIGTDHLVFGQGSVLTSCSPFTCSLTYTGTGAAVRGTDVSGSIENIYIITSDSILDFSDSTGLNNFVVYFCIFQNANSIGSVSGFDDLNIDYIKYLNSKNLMISGITHFTFTRNLFDENSVVIAFDYESDSGATVADDEVVYKEETTGLGNIGHLYKNISGGNITISGVTDYTDALNWEDVTDYILKLEDTANITEVNISNNRMQSVKGSIALLCETPLAIQKGGIVANNTFLGEGLVLEGASPFDDGSIKFLNNVGLESPTILPTLNTPEINNINNPQLGETVFNSTEDTISIYTSSGWTTYTPTPLTVNQYTEEFEAGVGSFVFVNNGVNNWVRGSDVASTGTSSIYISDNGTNAQYTINNSEISHAYVDIAIPSGITEAQLEFDWKCEAEVGYDYGRVYKAPTSFTPTAGTLPGGPSTQIGASNYNNNSVWQTESISLGAGDAGTTVRFIWTWRNDGSVGTDPGFCIDNVKLNTVS